MSAKMLQDKAPGTQCWAPVVVVLCYLLVMVQVHRKTATMDDTVSETSVSKENGTLNFYEDDSISDTQSETEEKPVKSSEIINWNQLQ